MGDYYATLLTRVSTELHHAAAMVVTPVPDYGDDDVGDTDEMKSIGFQNLADIMQPLHLEIHEILQEARQINDEWTKYISRLPADEKEDEQRAYTVCVANNQYNTHHSAARRKLMDMGKAIQKAKGCKRRADGLVRVAAGLAAAAAPNAVDPNPPAVQFHSRPPNSILSHLVGR